MVKIQQYLKSTSEQYIGVITNDDLDTYSALLAILFSGKAFVPINPKNPAERNKSIIEQAGISIILNSNTNEDPIDFHHAHCEIVKTDDFALSDKVIEVMEVPGERDAYILFTSGSTGVPKGVPITRNSLFAFTEAFFALGYQVNEKDRFLQMFDLTFDLSIMSYFAPLCIGASILTVPAGEIKYSYVYRLLSAHKVTFALMVPSLLSYLRPFFREINLPDLKYSLFCGEALYEDLVRDWKVCVPNALIQNVYGPTEATIFCLVYDIPENLDECKSQNGIVCIGKPMINMGAVTIDDHKKINQNGEKGELCLYGAQVTNGYWKNEEKTREALFTDSLQGEQFTFYRTGDLCYLDEELDFMYLGRLDHQVKIQGFRVELSEIEHHVREFTNLSNVAAIAYKNKFGSDLIHLYIDPYAGDKEELKKQLASVLPQYMIPHKMTELDTFPLNVNGKIDRKELKNRLETRKS